MRIRSRAPENTDPLLHPFLQAEDESEAQLFLEQLIAEHAQPLVREITRSKLHAFRFGSGPSPVQEADDVCSEVVLQLLSRLRDLRNDPRDNTIANFRSYVAAVAYNSCTESLRRKYPERHRLRNRLRYLLSHDPSFALWEGPQGSLLCGLAEWKDNAFPTQQAGGPEFAQTVHDKPNLRQLPPRALLDVLFSLSGRPLALDELVGLTANIWAIDDLHRVENNDQDEGEVWDRLPDSRVNVAVHVERRMHLTALWKEICELRPLQRAALLLNLHDPSGQDMLPLLVLTGVARFSEIASSLDMTMPEFTELWDDLPLDDATIAQRMKLTRQQVINLRKSARERLARRMARLW
jgi:RNA polymerase sigma factor (sigma-70 family)